MSNEVGSQRILIWDLSVLYLLGSFFFGFQFKGRRCPFWTRDFFYPPEGEQRSGIPRGPNLRSFSFISLRELFFLGFNLVTAFLPIWTLKFFIPRGGIILGSPMGSHLILFLFYILPKHFFDLKFAPGNRPFFRPRFFIPRRVSNEVGTLRWPLRESPPGDKKLGGSKKASPRRCFWNQKNWDGVRYKKERESNGTP